MIHDTRLIMGMPITVALVDGGQPAARQLEEAFATLVAVDARFSTYKPDSEVSRLNTGALTAADYSADLREVLAKCEAATATTNGFFDAQRPDSQLDPSGLVKGWAIARVAEQLRAGGARHFFVDAGGDIVAAGYTAAGRPWSVGIRHPCRPDQLARQLAISDGAVATSGVYERGRHIYNPHTAQPAAPQLLSLTVVGPNIETADVLATAAFAMGASAGLQFVADQPGYEALAITADERTLSTTGFPAQ
ncbi:MAG TPA: FAD:protein FMN transferase [Candidatus Saccharimonadia bacterium]|nr:FAD:protein FMN transferase [Candidatus Saccharimonadia bacterium]